MTAPSNPRLPSLLLLDPSAVPTRLRDRAIPLAAIVLSNEDLAALDVEPAPLDDLDGRLARMLVEGRTLRAIAADLGVTTRSVERRLARLRERLGVDSTAALIAELARSGF